MRQHSSNSLHQVRETPDLSPPHPLSCAGDENIPISVPTKPHLLLPRSPTLPGLPNPEAPHDQTKFVNHDLLLGAVRNGAKLGYVSYDVDLHDDFQYVLEMEVDVHDNVKILDDHHSELHSFVHPDGSQMVFNDLPSGWKVGDHIIGSHDGRWNEIVDFDHPLGYGVTLSRKIEKMQKDRSR